MHDELHTNSLGTFSFIFYLQFFFHNLMDVNQLSSAGKKICKLMPHTNSFKDLLGDVLIKSTELQSKY